MSFPCQFCNAPLEVHATACASCGGVVPPLRLPGERVADRFEVVSVLGVGPLGVTYRVRDLMNGYEVAYKSLADELCPTAESRADFVSKIEMFSGRMIAGCTMPMEVGDDGYSAYVISPIIEGATLRSVLGARSAKRQRLTQEEALRVMLALSSTASALHSATPHGALRPENVMVTPRGLILTDCAIAVMVAADKLQPRLRAYARAMPFVSPEAAAGKRVTATSDLYALGAIATELLASAPTLRALDYADLPAPIANALRTMLERDPTKRPGALAALLDELSKLCGFDRRPVDAPLPLPEVPSRPARPTRASVEPPRGASSASASSPPFASSAPDARTVSSRTPVSQRTHERDLGRSSLGSAPGVSTSRISSQRPLPRRETDPPGGREDPPTADVGRPGRARGTPLPAIAPPAPVSSVAPVARAAAPRIPSLPGVGRGLPAARAPLSLPKLPGLAARPSVTAPSSRVDREAPREGGDIDPKLLRAARKLERQRSRDGEEINVDDLEVLDD